MGQGLASFHKILKDETRQKIITLLNEKGSLSYSDLMESTEVLSTGLLNYHLKVLGDLLQKNENGKYVLSEKGQLAHKVLTEFPSKQSKPVDKRIWAIFTIASVTIALLNGYFIGIPLERTIAIVVILLLTTGFAFYIRVRPSTSTNRVFFIAVGTFVLGFVFWAIVVLLMNGSGLRYQLSRATGNFGDDFFFLTSLIICWIAGGFIGDWVGRRRNYIIPVLRV
jgi:hypothetical protein